jgi:hypothetical protein
VTEPKEFLLLDVRRLLAAESPARPAPIINTEFAGCVLFLRPGGGALTGAAEETASIRVYRASLRNICYHRGRERVTPLGVDNKIYEPLLEAKEEEK